MADDKALIECWECHKPIGTTAKKCPHCGADQSANPAITAKAITGCLFLFLFCGVVFAGVQLLSWLGGK
jgi:hypothetical protein